MKMNELFPHQVQGVEFLRSTPRVLLADEMGLGKTVQTIGALDRVSPVLVICPASVIGVWEKEISTWSPEREVTSLRGTIKERERSLGRGDLDIVLVNYEVVAKLLPSLMRIQWAALVLDEAHRVKNRKAQVTKAVQSLSRGIPRRYLLTGTPILNRPDDLWALLNLLLPERYRSYWKFVETYCSVYWNGFGWEVGGPKAPDKLQREISPFFLRREKSQVLKDLPPKILQQIWVDLEGTQLREYQRMREELIALLDSGESVKARTVMTQLLRLRQICVDPQVLVEGVQTPLSGAKAQALIDLLEGRNGGKVVIFSQWSRVVKATSLLLAQKGIPHLTLTGETPQTARPQMIEQFQTDPRVKAFVSTIGSGGLGVTLTAADTVVFLDKDWTPALNSQAIDRLHRVGQKSTVWVYEILTRQTVEEYVERRLTEKESWAEGVLSQKILESREL